MYRLSLLTLCALFFCTACKTTPTREALTWPRVNALPSEPPEDLERSAPTSVLRRGGDGFMYVVGGVPNDVATGTAFLARYSGDWPLEDLPRPPLAAGWVLKRFGRDVALVGITYALPDSELEGLEVTWETPETVDDLGKGLGRVVTLAPSKTSDVQLSVGEDLGVQAGDIYAILAPLNTVDDAQSVQLARRLLGICLVERTESETANCRLWRGSSMVPGRRSIAVDDRALFLEHTYGKAPREGVIQIAAIEGDTDNLIRNTLRDAFELYVDSFPLPNATVEVVPESYDATRADFHRAGEDAKYVGRPQLLVAASIVKRGDVDHLVVNYTGVGPPSGPGMVAAPPERGVDLGPVASLSTDDVRALAGVVWGGLLVYRGQTSEALIHLQLLLSDPSVRGPLRWHTRDQYAMRWAALGFVEQALWLVLEDEAMAKQQNDERAYLNALGTRVRLYDLLDRPERALEASSEYLARRRQLAETPDAPAVLSALGMHAEMLFANGKLDEGVKVMQTLREICQAGCGGDLYSMLSGIYWTIPEEAEELRARVLTELVDLGQTGSADALASARMYQGLAALGEERLEDALIAFLEAERLYGAANNLPGLARTKYFMFMTQLARQEAQKAFELAVEAIEHDRELGDFAAAARTYDRLATLYTTMNPENSPGPWLGAARDVLAATIQGALARGNYSRASESLFGLGAFLLRLGSLPESQLVLQRGVLFAIRSTRFDIAAMCHLWLGIIAREQNDPETFRDEINRARVMAEISEDPEVMEAIERALNPPEQPDTPTQLL